MALMSYIGNQTGLRIGDQVCLSGEVIEVPDEVALLFVEREDFTFDDLELPDPDTDESTDGSEDDESDEDSEDSDNGEGE